MPGLPGKDKKMFMPRFDLMRNHIESLRAKYKKDAHFLKAVYNSAYGVGYYSKYSSDYARLLLND